MKTASLPRGDTPRYYDGWKLAQCGWPGTRASLLMEQTQEGGGRRQRSFAQLTDGELAAAMVPGGPDENAAWREFQRRYGERLLRYIVYLAGPDDLDECKDIWSVTVAERIPPAIRRFVPADSSSPLLSWACTIARNVFLDRVKAKTLGGAATFVDIGEIAIELN